MGSSSTLGDISARLTLDSASFDSKLAASGEQLDRHGALAEKASARARAAWEKELIAQDKAQRQLEAATRAKELAALKSDILSRSLEKEAESINTAGHASVTQMQATSAAVRSFEGNPGIRAVERFLTTLPGVGAAAMVAFPVVGAIAFGAVVIDGIAKLAEFIKTAQKMPQTIQQGFGSLNLSTKTATDELQLTNDTLQNSIDKLEHKPQNEIKIAIDEATLAADRFSASVEAMNGKIDGLLSKNKVGGLSTLLGWWGTKSTASVQGTAEAFGAQENNNAFDLANAATPEQTAAAQKALKDTQDARLAELRRTLHQEVSNSNSLTAPDNKAVIADIKGEMTAILNQQKLEATEIEHAKLESQNKQLEADKALAEQQKQAASKASEERLRAMQVALNEQKQQGNVSVSYEYQYWTDRLSAFSAGSSQYAEVVAKSAELAVQAARAAHEKIVAFQRTQREQSKTDAGGSEIIARTQEDFRKDAVKQNAERGQDYLDANQLSIVNAHNDAREREAELTDAAGRSMTRYAAAVELARVHAQEFETVMLSLQANLDVRKQLQLENPTRENARGVTEAQGAIATAQSQYSVQSRYDQDDIYGRQTTAIVGATDALNEFIIATRDSGRMVHDFIGTALGGFNSEAVKAISGQRTSFGNFGAGLGRDVAGMALQKGEGSILSMFGLGSQKKPTGTKGDPLYVQIAGMGGAGAGSNPLGSAKLPGVVPFIDTLTGGGSGGGDSAGPDWGKIAGTALSFLPGFADGGTIGPNTWAMVGERGPEPIFSGAHGLTVLPNSSLSSGGGGGDTHHWNIDARGSNDPAQTAALVQRGIMAAAPRIAAMAIKGGKEQSMRSPSTQR